MEENTTSTSLSTSAKQKKEAPSLQFTCKIRKSDYKELCDMYRATHGNDFTQADVARFVFGKVLGREIPKPENPAFKKKAEKTPVDNSNSNNKVAPAAQESVLPVEAADSSMETAEKKKGGFMDWLLGD